MSSICVIEQSLTTACVPHKHNSCFWRRKHVPHIREPIQRRPRTESSGIRPGGAMKRNKKLWMMGTENKRTDVGRRRGNMITTKRRKRKKEGAIIARSDFRSGSSNGTRRRNTTLSAHKSPVYPHSFCPSLHPLITMKERVGTRAQK